MSDWLNPEEPGKEIIEDRRVIWGPLGIKNTYCPYDGHYCEQPECENCQFEKGL